MYKIPLCILIGFTNLVAIANNKLTIVANSGGSSALHYYQNLNIQDNSRPLKKIPTPVIKPMTEFSVLPIVSKKLSPGKVEPRLINANGLIRPFFMVGDDNLSIEWLTQRANYLTELQAVGLVVNVKHASTFNQLKRLVPNVLMLPTSGDDIADRLNLSHYPVLITATAIEQ